MHKIEIMDVASLWIFWLTNYTTTH